MKPDCRKPENDNHPLFPLNTDLSNFPDIPDIRNIVMPDCNRRFSKNEKALSELLKTETTQKRDVLYTIIRMSEAGTLTEEQFRLLMLAYSVNCKI